MKMAVMETREMKTRLIILYRQKLLMKIVISRLPLFDLQIFVVVQLLGGIKLEVVV
jgi:hypothetical protein